MTRRKTAADLRSHRWFGREDFRSFGHRSRAKQAGFSAEDLAGLAPTGPIPPYVSPLDHPQFERLGPVARALKDA